jgi:hypothetical protein
MSISPIWINEDKTILQLNYEPPILSWEEYDDAIDLCAKMAMEVKHSVCVIYNPGSAAMPKGPVIQHLRRAARLMPTNVTIVVTDVQNSFARSIIATATRFIKFGNLTLVSSLDEAYVVANHLDQLTSAQLPILER